ncbi:hypothetical protein INT47_007672 [Mucor saturninus]|uniref:Uncharacterized protein n=1 Tax=Mucor saturninus TaxID=64648 RepID=A0A8H7QR37_9FUNG|nr:hypothetical protein INT47_007672 [Mucor saturninus]
MSSSKHKKIARAIQRFIQENGAEELQEIFDEQSRLDRQFINDNVKDMTQILKNHLKQGGRYSTLKMLELACGSLGIDIECRASASTDNIQWDYSDDETAPGSSTLLNEVNNDCQDINKDDFVRNIGTEIIDDEEQFLYGKLYERNDYIISEECTDEPILPTEIDTNTDNILTNNVYEEQVIVDNKSDLTTDNSNEEQSLLAEENKVTLCLDANNEVQHNDASNPIVIEETERDHASLEVNVQKAVISPTGTGESVMITIIYRVIEQQIHQLILFEFSRTLNAAEIDAAILKFQSYVAYVINYVRKDDISHNRDVLSMLYNMYISKESIVQSMRRIKGSGGYSGKTLYSTMSTIRHTRISDLCRYGGIVVQLVNTNFVIPFVTPEIISVKDVCEKHTKICDIYILTLRYETKVLQATRDHLLSTPALQVLNDIVEKNKNCMSVI